MTKNEPVETVATHATSATVRNITSTEEAPTDTSKPTEETSSHSVEIAIDLQQKISRLRSDCKICLAVIWKARERMVEELTLAEAVQLRTEVIANRSRLTSICNQIGDINNELWISLRPNYNSDASTTRVVQSTEAGRIEKKLESEIKMAGAIASGLLNKIELAQEELKGI